MENAYKTFIAEDGLLHCASCGGALERLLPQPVLGRNKFPTTCPCRQKEIEERALEEKEKQHRITVDNNTSVCFHEKRMRDWTFANDDGSTPTMDKAKAYVANWNQMKKEGIGLLLWGGVGTGKTYMAACIANALLQEEKRVLMTDFATISNISVFDQAEYVSSLCRYDLLIIDDLGAERSTEFALQNVFDVINRRWESGKPLIITTNLSIHALKECSSEDMTRLRIYDRILDMCKPILVDGESKRAATGAKKHETLTEIFKGGAQDGRK